MLYEWLAFFYISRNCFGIKSNDDKGKSEKMKFDFLSF